MTKKIFAMFLAVLMVVSMLPTSVFAASCPGTGYTHTKSNCDYTEVKVTAPDCGTKGYTTYKCDTCGDTFVADWTDPVGEHTWVDADYVAPTCEKAGSEGGKKCSTCGTVVNATVIPALGVGLKCEFGAWLPANVDCTTGGKQTATCVHCGNVKEREVAKVEGGHVMGAWELKTPATAEANGLAVKKCQNANCGYTLEQVVFFDHDHDSQTLVFVAEVAAKCEATGVKAHYECRVCGQKFVYGKASATATVDTYNLVTDADLVIKTLHNQILDTLNCKTTTYVCNVEGCGKIIKVDAAAAHKYPDWTVQTAPTCTTDGFQKRTCTVCLADTQTQVIPALGHIEGSWTVPATCVQYSYTYTYCLRQGCVAVKTSESVKIGDNDVSFDLTLGSTALTQPIVGAGFYLNVYQGNLDKTLYFTGEMNGYYFATSEDITNAVKVYLEEVEVEGVENAYRMYFYSGSVKNYIAVIKSGTYFNVKFGADYSDKYWTWNDTYKVLTTKVDGNDYYLGTYNYFTTLSASKISYLENPESSFATKMTVSNANGVALLTLTPNTTAGFDSTNHNWAVLSKVDPTCLAEGVKISYCADNCGVATKTETLTKVDHDWVADTTKGSDNDGVDEATCTTAGKKYFVCDFEGCSETKEEAVAALGHELTKNSDETVKVFTEPGNHTNPVAYDYNYCERCKQEVNKTNYRAWADAGKVWDTLAAAEAAHGTLTAAAAGSVAGSCTVVGYTAYTCNVTGCSEIVRVKIAGTGAHVFPSAGIVIGETTYTKGYQAATCTAPGYSINYKCARCEKLVDEAVAENKLTVIPALGHTWTEFTADEREDLELGDYVKAPCGTPVYNNWIAYCSVCNPEGVSDLAAAVAAGTVKADTTLVEKVVVPVDGALCTATVYELYKCHCGETHMRGYLAAGKNVGHEWIVDTTKTKTDATHFEEGHVDMVCKYCGTDAPEEMEVIAKLPHKNAAGEEFTNACNDPITDRHCVLCCAADCKADTKHDCTADQDEDTTGVQTCACVIANQHNWGEVTYVDSICGNAPYVSQICSICYKTSAVDATEYWTGVIEKGNKVMAPITGLGHKPVAADEEKYGAYTYVEIVHPEYVWVDGVVMVNKVAYEAKYIEYTAPTYTADGFAKFVCADCGQTIETVLPALTGLGFELKVENANGQEGITGGSLVNVTLYANGNNVAVNNFTLLAYFEGMIFVGAQSANDNFGIHVTKAENANDWEALVIVANAVNSADKKQQNITIGEKTAIVTMQFIAWTDETVEVGMFGEAYALDGTEVECAAKECEIEVREYLDFNEDGQVLISDLVQAEAILTGESEKTYDVAVDADKDGEITLYDLNLIYEAMVNAMSDDAYFELIFAGMAEEHVEIVREFLGLNDHKHACDNVYCSYTSDVEFAVCPACGRAQ